MSKVIRKDDTVSSLCDEKPKLLVTNEQSKGKDAVGSGGRGSEGVSLHKSWEFLNNVIIMI